MPDLPPTQATSEVSPVWGPDLIPLGCEACRQVHLLPPARAGQPCPACGQPGLEAQPALLRPEPPERCLPFRRTRADLLGPLQRFVAPVWIRPDGLRAEALQRRAVPVYLPMWLVDAEVAGVWQAEAGFDYQVESSQESFAGGGWQTRRVVETRARWEPRAGQLARRYDNVAVPALRAHARLMHWLGAYAPEQAGTYSPEQLKESALRVPDLPPDQAWPEAESAVARAAAAECQQAVEAQHLRSFRLQAEYPALNWTLLLLPAWFTWYSDDDGRLQPIWLNGVTGQVGGVRLASQRRGWTWALLVLAAAAALFVGALACFLTGVLFPPLIVLGGLAALLAFAVALAAIVPAAWPWQWNRGQKLEAGGWRLEREEAEAKGG